MTISCACQLLASRTMVCATSSLVRPVLINKCGSRPYRRAGKNGLCGGQCVLAFIDKSVLERIDGNEVAQSYGAIDHIQGSQMGVTRRKSYAKAQRVCRIRASVNREQDALQ